LKIGIENSLSATPDGMIRGAGISTAADYIKHHQGLSLSSECKFVNFEICFYNPSSLMI